jgi:hypothetical protein
MISVHSWTLFDDLRIVIADAAVQKNRRGQFQLVQNFEQAPIPDPVAVVAPGEIARRLLRRKNCFTQKIASGGVFKNGYRRYSGGAKYTQATNALRRSTF